MRRLIILSVVLIPMTASADRLGALKSNTNVLLSTQTAAGASPCGNSGDVQTNFNGACAGVGGGLTGSASNGISSIGLNNGIITSINGNDESVIYSSMSVSYMAISSMTTQVLSSSMTVKISSGNALARVGGSYFEHTLSTGNNTSLETDLYQETIGSNVFTTNGDCLEVRYGGSFVGSGVTTRDLKFYVTTTTVFDTGGISVSVSGDWRLEGTICKGSQTTICSIFALNTAGASSSVYTQFAQVGGLQLTGNNVFKLTGQSSGVGANSLDITAKLGKGFWLPSIN